MNDRYGGSKKMAELTLENIRDATQQLDDFLACNDVSHKERMTYRYVMEDILLAQREIDPDACFRIQYGRPFRDIGVLMVIRGEKHDFLSEKKEHFHDKINWEFNRYPRWSYRINENIYIFHMTPVYPRRDSLRYLLSYMKKENRYLNIAFALRFANMALAVLEPILTARIIVAYSGSQIKKILIVAALILAESASSSMINWIASRMLRKSYSSMLKNLQKNVTESVLQISTGCMDRKGNGVFTQRMTGETEELFDRVDELLEVTTEIFRLVSLLIAFAVISVKMCLFELVLFIVYFLIQKAHTSALTNDSRACRVAAETHTGFVGEMVRGHRDIKLLHCEDSFLDKINESADNSVDMTTDMRLKSMKYIMVRTQFVSWTNFIYMALLALFMARDGMLPATALTLFNYNGNVYVCSRAISSITNTVYGLLLSTDRVYQLVEGDDFEKEKFGLRHLETVRGDIEIRDVKFSYRDSDGLKNDVLDGLSIRIRAGESVAIVGESGCGKSTVFSLLTRLYDPDRGSVMLDGADVRELDRDSLRNNITMISQAPYIFNRSIRENLTITQKDLTEKEMVSACRLACIHEDIMRFPRGYDTIVGEGGVTLSGGQRQRLALARGILRKSPVILLDEATSALDNVTQEKVQRAIENLNGRNTIIIAAHRLSTVINCDRILFMEGGRILAEGKHADLMETCMEYRQLYAAEGRTVFG